MRKQINIMLKTLDSVLVFLMLLSLFIFIFAIMGMHLFGGLFTRLEVSVHIPCRVPYCLLHHDTF